MSVSYKDSSEIASSETASDEVADLPGSDANPKRQLTISKNTPKDGRKRSSEAFDTATMLTHKSKRGAKKKTPDMPKRPLSGYNYFFKEQRAIMAQERLEHARDANDTSEEVKGRALFAQMGKDVATRWKTLSPEDKKRFEDLAVIDMERYQEEMIVYTAQKKREKELAGDSEEDVSDQKPAATTPAPSSDSSAGNPPKHRYQQGMSDKQASYPWSSDQTMLQSGFHYPNQQSAHLPPRGFELQSLTNTGNAGVVLNPNGYLLTQGHAQNLLLASQQLPLELNPSLGQIYNPSSRSFDPPLSNDSLTSQLLLLDELSRQSAPLFLLPQDQSNDMNSLLRIQQQQNQSNLLALQMQGQSFGNQQLSLRLQEELLALLAEEERRRCNPGR